MRISHFMEHIGSSFTIYFRQHEKIYNESNKKQTDESSKVAPITFEELEKKVNLLNKDLKYKNMKVKYVVHKGTQRLMLKLYDCEEGKLIKEIPSEKVLDIQAGIIEYVGLLLNERV
jgi:flagellar protein FlaG